MILRQDEIIRLHQAFPASEFYVPPLEVVAVEAGRECRGHFNIIHFKSGLKADIYLAGRDDLHAWAFRAKEYSFGELTIQLAPPEYVIVRKLEIIAKEARKNICATFAPCSTSPASKLTERC